MMQDGSMADELRESMEKKEGSKSSFSMAGQYTSTVMQEEGPSGEMREYVMYESPNGESMKVYGNWNEFAVSQDEEGNMMIADEDYPIVENENGEYVLDEATFDAQSRGAEMGGRAEGGPGASKMEDLMQMLGQARGEGGSPAPGMANGGKIYEQGGEIRDGRRRLTVSTSRMGSDRGTMINPTFYADGEPVSPRQAANIYKADYLRESDVKGTGAPDFNRFVQNAIMRSMTSKGQAGGMRGSVRAQQRELMEDREKAGVEGLLRGLSKYR